MKVYIVRREYNLPTAEQANDNPVLGVYLSQLGAESGAEGAVIEDRGLGLKVIPPDSDGDHMYDDWDTEIHIDEFKVLP